jgi:hypothetical protein
MTEERIPNLEDVERFYARQRQQILGRIARSQPVPRRRAGLPAAALAAAATLAIAALGLALFPLSSPVPDTAGLTELVSRSESLPLSAFGAWDDEEMLDRADRADMGSLDWLLEGESSIAGTDSPPGFLEPFGSWPEANETASGTSST